MLTEKQIDKAAKLEALTSGYHRTGLTASCAPQRCPIVVASSEEGEKKTAKVSISLEENPVTGERRLVQKYRREDV